MGTAENVLYKEKLVSAEHAAGLVKTGDTLFFSEFLLFPEAIDKALAARVDELSDIKIWSTSVTKVPEVILADPGRKTFIFNDYHFSAISRKLCDKNLMSYTPVTYHQGPRFIRKYHNYDIAYIKTGPMDPMGYFNYGLSNSVAAASIAKAKLVVIEINENIPYCLGGNNESIHISRVNYIVEGNNSPLLEIPAATPTDTDVKIAEHIMKEIEDGATIQLGIGGLPNVVGKMIADSDLKDLGIHTEMLVDSCVDLYHSGRVTGATKAIDQYKMTYTFAMGTKKLYEFLHQNPTCASYPVNYCNDPRILALNPKVIAINNALHVDLFSQVSSESVGTRHISGTGGQLDFIFGAFNSKGGKGIIALSSTKKDKEGNLQSSIVPTLQNGTIVTVPRSITQYVATEYGIVNVKGKATWQRAEALISISHPSFQDDLVKHAEKVGIWVKSNKK